MDFVRKVTIKMKPTNIMKTMDAWFDSWCEWQMAKKWSKKYHPAWLYLATQTKRPEIKRVYRKKVLEAYHKKF